ncbi:MAG: hypothetical protein R3F65_30105 [bacterium]
MLDTLGTYFTGEKHGAVALLVIGGAALTAGLVLVATKSDYRAMAIPLGLVALIQLAVGVGLYARTDPQVDALVEQHTAEPTAMIAAETQRMGTVMKSFEIIKIVELVIIALGVALTYAFAHRPAIHAVGIGLIIQATVMLVFDLTAERRAVPYVDALHEAQT